MKKISFNCWHFTHSPYFSFIIAGLIKSLNGLNISNNPLEFPPGEVIEKGTNDILKFLREMLLAKSQGRLTSTFNGGMI
jgi:hypothetical protein